MFFECSSFFPSFRSFHARERERKKKKTNGKRRGLNSLVTMPGRYTGNCYIVSSFFIKRRWFRFVCLIRKSDDEHQHEKTLTTTGRGNKNTVAFIQFEFGATLSRARDTSYLPIRNSIFIKLSQKFLSLIIIIIIISRILSHRKRYSHTLIRYVLLFIKFYIYNVLTDKIRSITMELSSYCFKNGVDLFAK